LIWSPPNPEQVLLEGGLAGAEADDGAEA
jgi:hypothetical protein